MALVLDDTPMASTANTYLLAAAADTYFEGHLFASAWTAATLGTKEQALVHATRIIDQHLFVGQRATEEQALQFPRYGVLDKDGRLLDGDEVPGFVKNATCLLALGLLEAGTTNPFNVPGTDDLAQLAVSGGVSLTFRGRGERPVGLRRYPEALLELRTVLRSMGGATELIRG